MGSQVKLIKITKEHFPLFYKWWNDMELRKLTSETYDKMSNGKIDKILLKNLESENCHDFIITIGGKNVGHISIDKDKSQKYYEFYIIIGEKEHWNKGYGTEAINQAIEWFFNQFPDEKCLNIEVNANNPRAKRCYEKCGFEFVKLKPYKKLTDVILMKKYK